MRKFVTVFGVILAGLSFYPTANALPIEGTSGKDILDRGLSRGNDIYTIDPDGDGVGFDAYVDMTFNGGGWTLGLASFAFDSSFTTDMTSNTGIAGYNSAHTLDLSALALNSDSQIRHQINNIDGSLLFDGFYTGSYHGTVEADANNWTLRAGDVTDLSDISILGNDWISDPANTCVDDFGVPWYYSGSACFNSHPTPGGFPTDGPYWNGAAVGSWRIYVREGADPVCDDDDSTTTDSYDPNLGCVHTASGSTPEPSILALFGLGLLGLGFAQRRNRI